MAKRFLRGVIQQANEDNMKLNNGIRSLKSCCYNEFFEIFNFTCLEINEMMYIENISF